MPRTIRELLKINITKILIEKRMRFIIIEYPEADPQSLTINLLEYSFIDSLLAFSKCTSFSVLKFFLEAMDSLFMKTFWHKSTGFESRISIDDINVISRILSITNIIIKIRFGSNYIFHQQAFRLISHTLIHGFSWNEVLMMIGQGDAAVSLPVMQFLSLSLKLSKGVPYQIETIVISLIRMRTGYQINLYLIINDTVNFKVSSGNSMGES